MKTQINKMLQIQHTIKERMPLMDIANERINETEETISEDNMSI